MEVCLFLLQAGLLFRVLGPDNEEQVFRERFGPGYLSFFRRGDVDEERFVVFPASFRVDESGAVAFDLHPGGGFLLDVLDKGALQRR